MSAQSDPRRAESLDADPKYYYRRSLSLRELVPAFGAAAGAAVVTFYVMKLFLERTPLESAPRSARATRLTLHRSEGSSARQIGRR
jgi:hypothetical protein